MDLEEAIENLKEYRNIKEFITENGSYGNTNLLNNSIETVLQALENSVSKDIIREKIEEIKEDKHSKYFEMFLVDRDIEKTIDILEELLK